MCCVQRHLRQATYTIVAIAYACTGPFCTGPFCAGQVGWTVDEGDSIAVIREDRSEVPVMSTPYVDVSIPFASPNEVPFSNETASLAKPHCDVCRQTPLSYSVQADHRPKRISVRPGDEIWLISTRAPGCQTLAQAALHRYESGIGFLRSSLDDYFANDQPDVTCERLSGNGDLSHVDAVANESFPNNVTMYVHGNRVDSDLACERGLAIYERLAHQVDPDERLRHVIWSWPSDTIRGFFLVDARVKASRTHVQSVALADFIARHPAATQIGLVGFSFGGRIILGAQHLLGGGDIFGRSLTPPQHRRLPRTCAAIWAPANPASWISATGLYRRALTSVDHLLIFYNSRDPLLRFYRKKIAESDTEALGFYGADPCTFGETAAHVEQFNVANVVGAHHKWKRYVNSSAVMRPTMECVLRRDAPAGMASAEMATNDEPLR